MGADPDSWAKPTWRQAWSDTIGTAHTVRFWMAEVFLVAIGAVIAVPFYPDGASAFEQAGISSAAVISATLGLIVVVFLGNWVAFSARNQRDDASREVGRLNTNIAEEENRRLTRQQLVEARQQLGRLMSDKGDMLISQSTDKPFEDEATESFSQTLDLLRSDSSIFDESHVGRFYAASTGGLMDVESSMVEAGTLEAGKVKAFRRVLRAEIECLENFVSEINTELNSLPR